MQQVFINVLPGLLVAILVFEMKGCNYKQDRHAPCTCVPNYLLWKTDTKVIAKALMQKCRVLPESVMHGTDLVLRTGPALWRRDWLSRGIKDEKEITSYGHTGVGRGQPPIPS